MCQWLCRRASHWYEFLCDGPTGAEINSTLVTLPFVDSERGDDDLTVNGVVVDDGTATLASDGGGGCFVQSLMH